MIAETIDQANNCFSISTNPEPKNSTKLTSNNQVIILPVMANAVICPETGKSLKHQELITKLRYKIKWMRSTANEIKRLYNTNKIRFICRSNIPKGRSDIRLICSGYKGPQRGKRTHHINRRRRSN
jgi:hypothetical protein